MLNKGYLLYVLIVSQVICQDIRSLYLSQIDDTKYECSSVGCSPSTTVLTLNLQRCQMACLNNQQCRTVTFDHNYNQCEMFMDIPSQYGTLSAHINMTTMIATDERQLSARMSLIFRIFYEKYLNIFIWLFSHDEHHDSY